MTDHRRTITVEIECTGEGAPVNDWGLAEAMQGEWIGQTFLAENPETGATTVYEVRDVKVAP